GVRIREIGDQLATYDKVVIATHADQALRLLEDPTNDESRLLGAFSYSTNPTVLHSQSDLLPRTPRAKASWNYLMPHCGPGSDGVLVTYDVGRLQSLPTGSPQLVSLNAGGRIADG